MHHSSQRDNYLSFQQRFHFGSAVFLHDELFSKLRLPKSSCYQGRFCFHQVYIKVTLNGIKFATTPCTPQGGALKIIHIINNALIFRPLLSSCCSLCLPQAAVTNEPILKEIIIYLFNSVSVWKRCFFIF